MPFAIALAGLIGFGVGEIIERSATPWIRPPSMAFPETPPAGVQPAEEARLAASELEMTRLRIDLETSLEWIGALQQVMHRQQTDQHDLTRALAERDQALAARDQALLARDEARASHAGPDAAVAVLGEQMQAAIHEVETIVGAIGLDPARLVVPARRADGPLPRGGPFVRATPLVAEAPNPSPRQLPVSTPVPASVSADLDRLRILTDLLRRLPLSAPLPTVSVASPFGARIDPLNGVGSFHPGIDLLAPMGAPVAATAPGVVVFAGWQGDYGEIVEIDHGFGLQTRYAHLSRILVRPGDRITLQQPVGLLGGTGRATGPHLHYEVVVDGHPQDPAAFLKARRSTPAAG